MARENNNTIISGTHQHVCPSMPDLHHLPTIFRAYPAVRAVYLFGSAALGRMHLHSDLDLALLPADDTVRAHRLDMLADLARHGFCDVDMVVLDTSDAVLNYEAVRPNCLVYARDDFDHATTACSIIRHYLDLLPYLDVQRKAYKHRLQNGQVAQKHANSRIHKEDTYKGETCMVRAEVIRKRLQKLDEYLAILATLQSYNFDEFKNNPEHYGSTERFLHLAIEALLDMGTHVIADMGLGIINRYNDIPTILADAGYIDHELQETWIRLIGFRNILVHNYLDIDAQVVYNVLHHHLTDIESLKQIFAPFL
jgi:uncharacterized protein YutE (UPF0331/DUF86 family)/predicted nucleotidyltransferase